MFIKQISVFLENQQGALRELTEILGKGGIDLMALSIADTQSFGVVRLIVSSAQIDPALELLKSNGFIAKVNNVICAEVEDRPLGLCELLTIIEKADLSVEYMYSFVRPAGKNAHLILRLSDKQKAVKVFEVNDVKTMTQEEIDTM
ncbi:MAG: acetolactate synthase [Clostridiales bacterium]|nr:acetolactate synthase [Clostridiales bacterium]